MTPAGAEAFVGDKGYDSDALVQSIQERGMKPVIPQRNHRAEARECDWLIYKERHLIECFFKIKSNITAECSRAMKSALEATWAFCVSSRLSFG